MGVGIAKMGVGIAKGHFERRIFIAYEPKFGQWSCSGACREIGVTSAKPKASDPIAQLFYETGDDLMSIGTILLIILVIALLGGFSGLGGGPFYGTGYYGGGGLGLVLIIVLILVLLGKL